MQELSPEAYDAIVDRVLPAAGALFTVVVVAAIVARKWIGRLLADARRLWRERPPLFPAPVAIVTLLGAAIRARYLAQPVRTDEAATFLYYTFQPFVAGISIYGSPNNHLLNTVLTHICWLIGGDVPALMRLPSFLAGVLIVPATYLAGRALANHRAGVMAAAVAAGMPALIDFSALARGYSMMTLAFLIALALAAMRSDSVAVHVAIGLAIAVGAFAVPVMLLPAAFLVVWMALDRQWRAIAVAAVTAGIVTAVLYTPVLVVSGLESLTSNSYVRAQAGRSLLFDPTDGLLAIGRFLVFGFPLPVAIVLTLLAIAGLVRDRGRIALALIAPLLIAGATVPYHRSWLFVIPLLAIGIGNVGRALSPSAASVLALVLVTYTFATDAPYYSGESGTFRDAEGTTLFLKPRLRPGDSVIATVPADVPLMYYFHRYAIPWAYLAARRGVHTYVVSDRSVGQRPPPFGRIVRRTDSSIVTETQ